MHLPENGGDGTTKEHRSTGTYERVNYYTDAGTNARVGIGLPAAGADRRVHGARAVTTELARGVNQHSHSPVIVFLGGKPELGGLDIWLMAKLTALPTRIMPENQK